jgi:hypothetical protein
MTLESLSGNGVLYTDAGVTRLAGIKYQIAHTLAEGRDAEIWHGTFTTPQEVTEHEDYSVELEDGRRGPCEISLGASAMVGFPAVYRYSFRGDTLTRPGVFGGNTDESLDNLDWNNLDESA